MNQAKESLSGIHVPGIQIYIVPDRKVGVRLLDLLDKWLMVSSMSDIALSKSLKKEKRKNKTCQKKQKTCSFHVSKL